MPKELVKLMERSEGSMTSSTPSQSRQIAVDELGGIIFGLMQGERAQAKTFQIPDLTVNLTNGEACITIKDAVVTFVLSEDTNHAQVCLESFRCTVVTYSWQSFNAHDPMQIHIYTETAAGGLLDDWALVPMGIDWFCARVKPMTPTKTFEPNYFSVIGSTSVIVPARTWWHC